MKFTTIFTFLTSLFLWLTTSSSTSHVEKRLGHPQLSNFHLSKNYLNLNHGSFGTTSKYVIDKQQEYVLQMEAKPDIWFRDTFYTLIDVAREETAKAVNVTADNLVLLENASSAVNGVFRSLDLKAGDIFIYFSTGKRRVLLLDERVRYLTFTYTLNI